MKKLIPSGEITAAARVMGTGGGEEESARGSASQDRPHNGTEHYHHEEHKLNERVWVLIMYQRVNSIHGEDT